MTCSRVGTSLDTKGSYTSKELVQNYKIYFGSAISVDLTNNSSGFGDYGILGTLL